MIVSAGHAIVGCKHRRWAGVKTCHGLFTPLNHDKLFITHKLTCAPRGRVPNHLSRFRGRR